MVYEEDMYCRNAALALAGTMVLSLGACSVSAGNKGRQGHRRPRVRLQGRMPRQMASTSR